MAERALAKTSIQGGDALGLFWTGLATGDTGAAVTLGRFGSMSFQFGGTFGGATIVLQGSNDATTWTTLIDMQGSNMSFTAAAFKTLRDVPQYIRPSVSGGSGVSLWVRGFARRTV